MKAISITEFSIEEFKELQKEIIIRTLEEMKANQKKEEVWLTRKEAKELLKISYPTLQSWTKKGFIKSYTIGNQVRYKKHEIDGALKENGPFRFKRDYLKS